MCATCFPPEQAARIFAQMLLILSVSPLFAPFVGGWMLPVTGWRSLFWLQVAAAGDYRLWCGGCCRKAIPARTAACIRCMWRRIIGSSPATAHFYASDHSRPP